jgi:hypothetical protein
MMRTITNIRPAETPALCTLSWLLLDPIFFSLLQSHLQHHHQITTLLVQYIEEYTFFLSFFLRKPQKISISELHLPILHVIRVKHAIIS